MKVNNKYIYLIISILALAVFSGCTTQSPAVSIEDTTTAQTATQATAEPTAAPTPTKEPVEENLADKYAGLEGVDLYDAVMVPKYEGTYRYKTETENQFGKSTIEKYYSSGSYKEHFTSNGNTSISIFNYDEQTVYSYMDEYDYCYFVKYELLDNGFYGSDVQPFSDEFFTLTASNIIDYNDRPTYYYERLFSEKDINDNPLIYINKFWIDLETKVQMHAEFYLNDEWLADSYVSEFITDIEIDDDMFLPPADKELTDDEGYAIER